MRFLRTLGAIAVFSVGCFAAETLSGTLIDQNCKGKDPVKHTKQCALMCAKSGFGLLTSDGKWLKFDDKGNTEAVAAFANSPNAKTILFPVEGAEEVLLREILGYDEGKIGELRRQAII